MDFIMSQNDTLKISAKDILVKTITSKVANEFVKKHHYSGKVVNNSQLHFGAFVNGVLHGVLSYGASMDKRKMQGLVRDTGFNEFLELNRMAFDDKLPKNSESRCIAVSLKLIKKRAPHIKWVVSFADATQCGDGTIYRASGFVLTDIRTNKNTARLQNGEVIHKMTLESNPNSPRVELDNQSYYTITNGRFRFSDYINYTKAQVLVGYQLRYVYFIDKTYRQKLGVAELPYSAIDENNAGMYKGKRITLLERAVA